LGYQALSITTTIIKSEQCLEAACKVAHNSYL